MCSNALNSKGKPAVSLMTGVPTFDIEIKNQKRGKFKTPPHPKGRQSNSICACLIHTSTQFADSYV